MTNKKAPASPSDQDDFFGEQFLFAFNTMVQTVKIHQDNNKLVLNAVDRFVKFVKRIMAEEDTFTLSIVNGRFYIQEEKLTYRKGSEKFTDKMLKYFGERTIDGMTIYPGITKASAEEILAFARMMNTAGSQKDPYDWLVDRLDEEDWPWISVMQDDDAGIDAFTGEKSIDKKRRVGFAGMGVTQGDGSPGAGGAVGSSSSQAQAGGGFYGDGAGTGKVTTAAQRKQRGRMDYSHALGSLVETSYNLSQFKRTGIRKTVRLVQKIVDNILEDESVYLAASSIRLYDDYTYTHSINVAMLSICLGKHVGLSRNKLEQLGLCGLFHDLGKTLIPGEIIRKPGKLTEEEMQVIQAHSTDSVRLLLKLRASWKRKSKILLAPFEHHLKYNLKGYPYVGWKKPISLFGRILAIADAYDALTSARVYRVEAITPDRALAIMMRGSNVDFDPILLKVFINMVGVYPLGTLVLLDDGGMGIVCEIVQGGDTKRPKVILLEPDGSGGFVEGKVIDLGEKGLDTSEYIRNILKTIHPSEYNIQPAEYLLKGY